MNICQIWLSGARRRLSRYVDIHYCAYAANIVRCQFWYFCEIFYVLSTAALKVAIGLFLLRVANQRIHILIIYTIMILATVFGGAFFFVIVFQCWPISDWWDLNPAHKNCINPDIVIGLTYGVSALNIIADWTLGLLPIFIVKDLQMSSRQKRLVSAILAFAAIGSTATIVRLPYIGSLKESFEGWNGDFLCECSRYLFEFDLPTDRAADNTVGVAIWTTVEIGVGITAGCLATLRPLIRMAFSRFGVSSSSRHRHTTSKGRITPAHPFDEFNPDRGHGQTITTITGNHVNVKSSHSRSSSQEQLASPDRITKFTVVEYDQEVSPERHEPNIRSPTGWSPQAWQNTHYVP